MLRRGGVATVAALLLLAAPAPAAPSLVEVARFSRPVAVSSPPGDPRLFVVEQQTGRIEVVLPDGTLLPDAFLDLGAEIATDNNERGLLNVAFAPDYAGSGRFYVFLTAWTPNGQVQVREYRRSAADPHRADPATARIVLRQDHPVGNHNGGSLQFGPDGALWLGIGDGGNANDDGNDAQQRSLNRAADARRPVSVR